MLLCTRHHTLVHEGGFRIEKDFQDRWTFLRPDGIAVPAGGLLSRGENKVFEPPPPV